MHAEPNAAEEFKLADPNLIGTMTPWELDFRQLESGPLETRIRVRQGTVLTLLEIGMDRAVHQTGQAPADTLTFGIPLSQGVSAWHGRGVESYDMISFGGKDGFDGVSTSRFHGLTFSTPLSVVEMLSQNLGIPLPDTFRRSGVLPDLTDRRHLRSATRLGRRYMTGSAPLSIADEEEILATLLRAPVEVDGTDRSLSRSRSRAVRIALELMDASAEDNIPVSQICAATGVSERTLNRAFREQFDMGPKAYFLRMRLGRMRKNLLSDDNEGSISDVANRWGFWHLGQLAQDYRKHFAELPSETLRHRAARSSSTND